VSRRVRVPAADELFRPTVVPDPDPDAEPGSGSDPGPAAAPVAGVDPVAVAEARDADPGEDGSPRPGSGRVRHDQKMTVYLTSDELLDLESARLTLRRQGLSVDRGRLVREAVAMALVDLEALGADSPLVHRLTAAARPPGPSRA